MITELFYPKELKEIIADLRAKGDLNERFCIGLNTEIKKKLLFHVFFIVLSIFIKMHAYAVFIFLLFPVFIVYELHASYKIRAFPYISGTKIELTLQKKVPYRHGIKLFFVDQKQNKYTSPVLSELTKNTIPDGLVGTTIDCYYMEDDRQNCMASIETLMTKYCPSASKLKSYY